MTHATVEVVTDIRHSVMIDDTRNDNLTDQARELLAKFYLRPGENPQDGFARASVAWATYRGVTDWALAQRLYDYSSRGWFGYASPVLSNAPLPGEKARGLPISCFGGYLPDSLEGLIDHTNEFRWLSVMGGGVGGHWSDVRSVSNKACPSRNRYSCCSAPGTSWVATCESAAAASFQRFSRWYHRPVSHLSCPAASGCCCAASAHRADPSGWWRYRAQSAAYTSAAARSAGLQEPSRRPSSRRCNAKAYERRS
jgi:hypothetical protein